MKASDSVTKPTGSVTNASGFEMTVFDSDDDPSERVTKPSQREAKGIGSEEGITKVNEKFSNAVPAIRGSEIVASRSQRTRRKIAIAIRDADAMQRSPPRNMSVSISSSRLQHEREERRPSQAPEYVRARDALIAGVADLKAWARPQESDPPQPSGAVPHCAPTAAQVDGVQH
jgi:hypothetical protein